MVSLTDSSFTDHDAYVFLTGYDFQKEEDLKFMQEPWRPERKKTNCPFRPGYATYIRHSGDLEAAMKIPYHPLRQDLDLTDPEDRVRIKEVLSQVKSYLKPDEDDEEDWTYTIYDHCDQVLTAIDTGRTDGLEDLISGFLTAVAQSD